MTHTLRLEPWAGDATGIAPAHAEVAAQTIAILTEYPRPARWGCYLARVGDDVVGIGAFKGAPDAEGTVEIAYQTFRAFEGRGHASAIVAALMRIARVVGGAAVVIAHTPPLLNPSGRALLSNGFVQADAFDDPEDGRVWYWESVSETAG